MWLPGVVSLLLLLVAVCWPVASGVRRVHWERGKGSEWAWVAVGGAKIGLFSDCPGRFSVLFLFVVARSVLWCVAKRLLLAVRLARQCCWWLLAVDLVTWLAGCHLMCGEGELGWFVVLCLLVFVLCGTEWRCWCVAERLRT